MKKGWIGGWRTTTWLHFENKVDFLTLISQMKNYEVKNNFEIFYLGEKVAEAYKKYGLYKKLLIPNGINYETIISKKLLPDNAIYVILNKTLFIVEIKYQEVAWSVDEKLQTCDFKLKQYKKLFSPLNKEVKYYYLLDEWFLNSNYKDVLDYIISVGCYYRFNYIPLKEFGLPIPKEEIWN